MTEPLWGTSSVMRPEYIADQARKTEALKLALEALEKLWNIIDDIDTYGDMAKNDEKLYRSLVERRQRTRFEETGIKTDGYELSGGAITAIKEALAQTEQEPKCNTHPKAPHGFNRNASHANDRYTCECEGWDAYDAGYQAGVMAGIEASMDEPRESEQEPVAMKFKIYKPTVPDPVRQGINNALLPWVYDQDRSSGFDATMWVTPVATLPPQRTWVGLTQTEVVDLLCEYNKLTGNVGWQQLIYMTEAKLKEKNQ